MRGNSYVRFLGAGSGNTARLPDHPSGDPTPSPEDVFLTRQIADAGNLLDVDVLDHIIIGRGRFVSMREKGLGFVE
jgi:DNA repair protein RadC